MDQNEMQEIEWLNQVGKGLWERLSNELSLNTKMPIILPPGERARESIIYASEVIASTAPMINDRDLEVVDFPKNEFLNNGFLAAVYNNDSFLTKNLIRATLGPIVVDTRSPLQTDTRIRILVQLTKFAMMSMDPYWGASLALTQKRGNSDSSYVNMISGSLSYISAIQLLGKGAIDKDMRKTKMQLDPSNPIHVGVLETLEGKLKVSSKLYSHGMRTKDLGTPLKTLDDYERRGHLPKEWEKPFEDLYDIYSALRKSETKIETFVAYKP